MSLGEAWWGQKAPSPEPRGHRGYLPVLDASRTEHRKTLRKARGSARSRERHLVEAHDLVGRVVVGRVEVGAVEGHGAVEDERGEQL